MQWNDSFNYPKRSKQWKENACWWKPIWELCGHFCPSCCYCLIVSLSFCCSLKEAPNQRSSVGPISRNAQNTHCSFSLDFHSYSALRINVWKMQKHDREGFHCVSSSLHHWHCKERPAYVAKAPNMSQADHFCSSLVKSGLTWLHPEELQFQARKKFACTNIDQTTKWSMSMNSFPPCLHF